MRSRSRWERGLADLRRQLALVRSFRLSPTDLVLDVGSGQSPNLRADVLCDRFVSDTSERACGAALVVDRPLVVADAEELPFHDGAFDFVICSHLLEHVRRPDKLLKELQRVGRRGYVETPSAVHERLYGNPFHKWYVEATAGALHLVPKPEGRSSDPLQQWFRGLYEGDPDLQCWINENLESLGFLVQYYWDEAIDFVIEGKLSEDGDFVFASAATEGPPGGVPKTLGQWVKHELSNWMRRRSRLDRRRLLELLACARCRRELHEQEAGLCCPEGHRFEIEGDLIYMV